MPNDPSNETPNQEDAMKSWSWHWLGYGVLVTLLVVTIVRSPSSGAANADESTVAVIDGVEISRAELMEAAAGQLDAVELERLQCLSANQKKSHDVLQGTLEGLVRDHLTKSAADEAGKEQRVWVEEERFRLQTEIEQSRIDELIRSNQRLARQPREQIEPRVREYLANEDLMKNLKEKSEISIKLEPYRVEVDAVGPSKGAGDSAPVTIVEFSDFECPYCKQVNPSLEKAVAEYGDKVRLVFRQFPLTNIHPKAVKAAEASLCAEDQGKFWEVHDAMFEDQKNLDVDNLKTIAANLELDVEAFNECLDSGRYNDQVAADLRAGASIGVSGTPAMFVNGRPMSGAVSFEMLAEVIDDELERTGGK